MTATGMGIDDGALEQLRSGFRGALLRSGDAGYDAARSVWNGMIDRKPALIARCTGVADVMAAVNFARERELLVSVRGGGHNVAGNAVCDGGLMIDLTPMKGIRVDPARRTAVAQGGVTWGEFDRETQVFGLATTGGQVSTTGIGGLTLGGGVGWLMGAFGLVVDNLLSVDLVTPAGEFVHASADENPELFWGLRGGGGNFGIATALEYQLHPLGPIVLGGLAIYPAEQASELLPFYRKFTAEAPDELGTIIAFLTAPPAPFVPPALQGKPAVAIGVCYAGSIEEGQRAVEPLQAFGEPAVNLIGPMPYTAVQQMFDAGNPFGLQVYLKSEHLSDLSDDVIDTVLAHTATVTSPLTAVIILPLGGAVARVPEDATAFSYRNVPFDYVIYTLWTDPTESERHIAWTRQFAAAMERFSVGVYVNEMMDEGEARVRAAYRSGTYDRLVALKNTYDPTNFLRMNQNIKPTP